MAKKNWKMQSGWTTFARVGVGQPFYVGGNRCIKRSSRTAEIGENGWFYFRKTDKVVADLIVDLV